MAVDLATLTKADFDRHLGTTFLMRVSAHHAIALELIEIHPLSTRAGAPREAFSLRFRAAGSGFVPQQIYALEHPVMGVMEIFLVPAGPDGAGMCYDAVFS